MVTTQVLLELSRSCVGMEIVTEVVGFAVAEVVKIDLVDVGTVGSLCGVNFALLDELLKVFFVSFSPGIYSGGASAMVKQPGYFYGSGEGVVIFQWGLHARTTLTISH
jgi:hypothetical protein